MTKYRSIRWKDDVVPPVFLRCPMVPLVIGIDDVVKEVASTSRDTVKVFLSRHCHSTPYLRALAIKGAMRHDINGVAVEPVSPEHQTLAIEMIKERSRELRAEGKKLSAKKGPNGHLPKLRLRAA
jgi:sRNA-binding protein